ncbi:hypothetical protein HanIR_Chr17g0873761 [Helianthus annuus]|nr:hypothetical protein HanIR_Chr17g0873761 [Helianthus annuus]
MLVDEKGLNHGAQLFIEPLELRPFTYNSGIVEEWNVIAVDKLVQLFHEHLDACVCHL